MQDGKCNLHLATWTGCLISGSVFSLLVSAVICSSSVSLQTRPADLQVASLDASLYFGPKGYTVILTAKTCADAITGEHGLPVCF